MIEIQFERLFGRFDYDIFLNAEGLTILTGPNGYGKTTILKSIEALGNSFEGFWFFMNLDFKRIIFLFENQKRFMIEKNRDSVRFNDFVFSYKECDNLFMELIGRRPYVIKADDNQWFDRRKGVMLSLNECLQGQMAHMRLSMEDIADSRMFSVFNDLQTVINEMKKAIGDVYFIREQRLIKSNRLRFDETETINVIEELPNKFKELMSSVQQSYSVVANELDSTYPSRLFQTKEGISKSDYEVKISDMASKFESLSKYDLSSMQQPANFMFKDEHAKALKVYFEDFEIKYRVYEDFIKKLDIYTDIINHRLSFKTLRISKEHGITVEDENKKMINLMSLSSGEKQEIVLFYDLIFNAQKDTLLLIDEPEISLHITWQKKFMDDLVKIIDYKGFNVIVATHSPQIINNYWDRQIDLGEIYGRQFDKR